MIPIANYASIDCDDPCEVPNPDASMAQTMPCVPIVEKEACVPPDLPTGHTGSKPKEAKSDSFIKGPIISMAGTVETTYAANWTAEAYETTSASLRDDFTTGCGDEYFSAVLVNPNDITVSIDLGFAFPLDKFGIASLTTSKKLFEYSFVWGGNNRPLIINKSRCRYHCGRGWEIRAKPCIKVTSVVFTTEVEKGYGGGILRSNEWKDTHVDVKCENSEVIDFIWKYNTAKCPP